MGFPIGYQGAFPIDVEVPGAPSDFDPDAAAWFEAVEASGANFGPNATIANANKAAWSDWVKAQKSAESPIAGRTNWQQLTQADEGFIQPLMGVSKFNIPALFGESVFTGFVVGDHVPALGLKGGGGRVLNASERDWDGTPQDDFSAGMWTTGAASSAGNSRMIGQNPSSARTFILNDARSMAKSTGIQNSQGDAYTAGTFPRSAFLSRSSGAEYTFHNGLAYVLSSDSTIPTDVDVTFFAAFPSSSHSDIRGGLVFYGRSINLEAMNTACVALSEAITW